MKTTFLVFAFVVFFFCVLSLMPRVQAASYVSIVVAGDSGGNVFAIDAPSGSLLWNVSIGGDTRSIAVSDNGQYIVAGTSYATALLSKDGARLWTRELGVNPTDPVPPFQFDTKLVSISADGNYVLVAHNDLTVRLYDNAGNEIWNDGFSATSVAIAGNGTCAVVGGSAGIRYYSVGGNGVWDTSDSTPSWTVSDVPVRKVAISSDGKYVVSGGRGDGLVRFYNATGAGIWSYRNIADRISVDISRDGTGVAAGNDDSTDSNGAQLAYFWIGNDGIWSASDGTPIWTFRASSDAADDVRAVAFCLNGSCIASGGAAGYARTYLHRIESATPVFNSTAGYGDEAIGVSFDGRYIVAADTQAYAIRFYDTRGAEAPVWTYNATNYIRSVVIANLQKQASEVWVPSAEGALVAGAVVVGLTGGVSTLSSAVSSPESFPSSRLAAKMNEVFPETLKKWLADFISSKRKSVIGQRMGRLFVPTKLEVISYAVALSMLTFAFSYAKVASLSEIVTVLPTVLATSIVVEFVKNFTVVTIARLQGVWTEHRLWYFGLTTFLFSSLVFRVPFSSPSRVTHNSPRFTKRSLGVVASSSVFIGLAFAGLFYGLLVNGFTLIGNIGLVMCLTMAFFETVPIPPMSGKDVYDWSKPLWMSLFITTFTLYMLCLLVLA